MYNNYNDELMNDLRNFEEYMNEQRQEEENKRQESEKN